LVVLEQIIFISFGKISSSSSLDRPWREAPEEGLGLKCGPLAIGLARQNLTNKNLDPT
jgi:hypothetical protein